MELHGAEESALCERCLGQRLHNGQRQTGPRLTTLTQTHGGTDKDNRHTEAQTKTKTTDTHRDRQRQRQRQRESNTQERYTDPDKEWQGWSKYRRWLTIMRKGEKI